MPPHIEQAPTKKKSGVPNAELLVQTRPPAGWISAMWSSCSQFVPVDSGEFHNGFVVVVKITGKQARTSVMSYLQTNLWSARTVVFSILSLFQAESVYIWRICYLL